MADPMKIRANVVGDSTEVKVLMSHEGLIKDFDGLLKELREIQKKQ